MAIVELVVGVAIDIPEGEVADLAALLGRRPGSEEGANMTRVLRGHGWLKED